LTGGGIGSAYRGGAGYGGYGGYGGSAYRGYGYRGYGYGCCGFGVGLGYWPYYGYGYGYGYPYYDTGYYSDPYSYYPDTSSVYQPAYQPAYQPTTTVVYPPSQPAANYAYPDRAAPVMREYDRYGQQIGSGGAGQSSSPIYLIAMKSHNIYAASSYSVNGATLNYVTMDHAEKQVPLSDIDREMTMRLNRERRVAFQLPAQQ
jgi:hypothetical protein